MMKQPMLTHEESSSDKTIHNRYRSILLVISVPIVLLLLVLSATSNSSLQAVVVEEKYELTHRKMPPHSHSISKRYAVIFDAGSSGSRVHVFCFDRKMNLVHIGEDLEVFVQIKPGLSAYAKDPQAAANSLVPLLEKAESVVPKDQRSKTPVRVGATAGLRALGAATSEKILDAVRDLLRENSSLKYVADAVGVLDGSQEGSYQWVTINYLLGNLGKSYCDTVGVVDLGGGSVQMAYAISKADAAKAPTVSDGEDPYVKEMDLMGSDYNLYVHSYLNYGLLAARAEILKVSGNSDNACILKGYDGVYKYGGVEYKASAPLSGSSLEKCRKSVLKALKVNESTCLYSACTFGGIWNGGGGDGQKNLFVASFFFDRAAEAGFIDPAQPVAKVHPGNFKEEAKRACKLTLTDAKSTYPRVDESNLPYFCMDLVYQYTLLVDGFGVEPEQEITLVKRVKYSDSLLEAAWPLGNAIAALSSSK